MPPDKLVAINALIAPHTVASIVLAESNIINAAAQINELLPVGHSVTWRTLYRWRNEGHIPEGARHA